ncbi:hypothetical protein [Nocardia sp. NPDC050406]|uniref:hypothetical protein n=1 Tax=Nocardia sp. NPDC050406 TaxID=3364318 RepID=UPI0037A76A70
MGNHFSADAVGLDVYMTNGGTDVFCDVLALAGSPVARTPWQRHLVLHFCDMARYARGMSGFDLAELPWTRDHRREQDFFLELVERAKRRIGWEKLHYTPAVDYSLEAFAHMLTVFRASETVNADFGDWTVAPNPYYVDRCVRHGIFQGEFECRLCDPSIQPVDAPKIWEMTSARYDNGVLGYREKRRIPDVVVTRILAIVGAPEHASVRIEGPDLEKVSALVESTLDARFDHWLTKVTA